MTRLEKSKSVKGSVLRTKPYRSTLRSLVIVSGLAVLLIVTLGNTKADTGVLASASRASSQTFYLSSGTQNRYVVYESFMRSG